MKGDKFVLSLYLERIQPHITEIMDTVELGEFSTEAEAREALELILDAADLEAVDDDEGEPVPEDD
jgi:hypothetical protein